MCIILLADQQVRVPMLLESFHPIDDPTHPGSTVFEQAYDVLVKNMSGQNVTKLFFGHPRNTVRHGQAGHAAIDINLPQHPDWLGERMFRERVVRNQGPVNFDLWFPTRSPHRFGPVEHFRARNGHVTIQDEMARLCNAGVLGQLLAEGLPTFFQVVLPHPIDPFGSMLLSFSFPGQFVDALITRALPTRKTFALVSPAGVWDRFIQKIARHAGDPNSPLHDIAQEVERQVRPPLERLYTADIDELRVAVLSDSQHVVYETREHGEKITFWEIRKLRRGVNDRNGMPMSAHIWYASGHVERAQFDLFFSVQSP